MGKVSGVAYRVSTFNELESVFEKILVLAETQALALSRNPILYGIRNRGTSHRAQQVRHILGGG